MHADTDHVVIVGAGLAGARTALALRDRGYQGRITIFGDETLPPYERPQLSKQVLTGVRSFDDITVAPPERYADRDIDLASGTRVVAIDPDTATVTTDRGDTVGYSNLILATGATARQPDCPGKDLPGVQTLRTYADAMRLIDAARPGARCVVMGLGLVGSEITATLRTLGCEVTAIEPAPGPLRRVLGPAVSDRLAELHEQHGAVLRLEESVTELVGDLRVQQVHTSHGSTVEADFVIAALGAVPDIALALDAGIPCGRGILTDPDGRTQAPGVFAVGDAAQVEVTRLGRSVVHEHWQAAIKQAERVTAAIVGADPGPEPVEWFWTDHYDHQVQVIGTPAPEDEVVIRGDLQDLDFLAFHLHDGSVTAATSVGRARELRRCAGLIRSGTAVSADDLTDEATDLRGLAQAE